MSSEFVPVFSDPKTGFRLDVSGMKVSAKALTALTKAPKSGASLLQKAMKGMRDIEAGAIKLTGEPREVIQNVEYTPVPAAAVEAGDVNGGQGGTGGTAGTAQPRKGDGKFHGAAAATKEAFAAALGDPRLDQTAAEVDFNGGPLQWYSAGLTFEQGPFQAQAMLNHLGSDRVSIPASWAGFLSLGYRVGQVVPYGLWSRVVFRQQPLPYLGSLPFLPNPVAAQVVTNVGLLAAANANTQSTTAVGFRWDCRANVDVKFQLDRIQARAPGSLWDRPQPGWNGRATVLTAVVDFVF